MDSIKTKESDELLYFLALALAPKIGPSVFKAILAYSGSAKRFFELPKGKVAKTPGVGPKLLALRNHEQKLLRQAEEIMQHALKKDFQILTSQDKNFPEKLKLQEDGPVILFIKGTENLNFSRTVGIVGTRSATSYGKESTKRIVEQLLPYQPTIISGLAYGIDIEAHRAALQVGLPTLAILGSPIDQIYPAVHRSTAEALQESGALISEYPPGSKMVPGNFPARNRIIAGLSDALIVVEAAEKGGALITAEIAYSYNKEVFAVPGNLQSEYSIGCNKLIKQMKANIYTGPQDIAEALGWHEPGEPKVAKPKIDLEKRSEEERLVIQFLLTHKEAEIDQISYQTGLSLGPLASLLLNLEFEGLAKSLPGKKYRLLV
ncbi:DNA-processing protein DprA [Algoriphagus namhaensis]